MSKKRLRPIRPDDSTEIINGAPWVVPADPADAAEVCAEAAASPPPPSPPPPSPAGRTSSTSKPITTVDRDRFRRVEILLEDGRPLGEALDPWQAEDFDATDRFQNVFLERPRGHSKTGDAGTLCVTELVLGPPGQMLYACAADEDQGKLLLQDVAQKFRRNPRLAPLATVKKNMIVMKSGGSSLRVLASDAPSSYGLRPSMVIVDELSEWRSRALWDSLYTSLGKRADARLIVISTAGWSKDSIAWEVRQIAESEPDWLFSSRGQCASWVRPSWLASQRRTLPAHVFARLHENRWLDGVGAYFTMEEVDGIFVDTLPDGLGPTAIGLDVGLTRDKTVIAAVRADAGTGLVCIDRLVTYHPPVGRKVDLLEVEADVEELARQTAAPVVIDPWQGTLLAQRLRSRGIAVEEYTFTAENRRKLFGTLLDLIRAGGLRCRPHPELRRELLGLEVQQTASGGWRIDHQTGAGHHDDHVIAASLAIGALWDQRTGPLELDEGDGIPAAEYGGNFLDGTPAPTGAPAWWPR